MQSVYLCAPNAEAAIVASEIIDGVERVTFENGSEMDVPFSISRSDAEKSFAE